MYFPLSIIVEMLCCRDQPSSYISFEKARKRMTKKTAAQCVKGRRPGKKMGRGYQRMHVRLMEWMRLMDPSLFAYYYFSAKRKRDERRESERKMESGRGEKYTFHSCHSNELFVMMG